MNLGDYNVYKTDQGWATKRDDATRASSVHDTQAAAYDAARTYAANSGGGDVSIHGRDGRVRDKNTIAPGNDPRNVKG